jgi:hypothetical protein
MIMEKRDPQAGAEEITEQVIEAGAAELDGFVTTDLAEGWMSRWEIAAAVYRAMRRVALANEITRDESS